MINAALLQRVVDASHDGIVVTEQEGQDNILIYANPAFQALTGYATSEILYQDCRFLRGGHDQDQAARAAIREALADGRPCRQTLRNYRKDGTEFWNELSITPVYNAAGYPAYQIGIQTDVTATVMAHQRIAELQAQLCDARREIERLKNDRR